MLGGLHARREVTLAGCAREAIAQVAAVAGPIAGLRVRGLSHRDALRGGIRRECSHARELDEPSRRMRAGLARRSLESLDSHCAPGMASRRNWNCSSVVRSRRSPPRRFAGPSDVLCSSWVAGRITAGTLEDACSHLTSVCSRRARVSR